MTVVAREPAARPAPGLVFPAGFRWGAATSAYQVEGAAGRARSIWDTFAAAPGAVAGGDTADVACDHYHRYRDDVALMADLGLSAYRFSVSWPRIQPSGTGPAGRAGQTGLDFYRRLVDELLGQGIEPWPTLYHWELPQPLEDAGGWPARDCAARFAEFAALVHGALGDRVKHWITINEPWCASFLGYGSGVHAPGRRDRASAVRAAHHQLLGHGLAGAALRAADGAAEVGIALDLTPISPASAASADAEAARRADGLRNRLFLDPLLRGGYPPDVRADLAGVSDFAHVHDGDVDTIAAPGTFLAINYYQRKVAAAPAADGAGGAGPDWVGSEKDIRFLSTGRPVTAMGWEVDASGLEELLRRIHREYRPIPLYVSENGAAFPDTIGPDGQVADPDRVAYIDTHLRACHRAIVDGIPLNGYFVWSLLDNFEWAQGYSKRFGIVYVDYATQERTPKASAGWYGQVIRRHALDAE